LLIFALLALLLPVASFAQQLVPVPQQEPPHDISMVDPVESDSAIATPLPEHERKRLERYELPELAGSKQALGSLLLDGRLRKPLVDYSAKEGTVDQRLSLFEGGLVVVKITAGGTTIRKKLLIPDDALQNYMKVLTPDSLDRITQRALTAPSGTREAVLRIYRETGGYVERTYDPLSALPKELNDRIAPLQDLMRAIAEDRTVTSSVANYEPKVGDRLVSDDQQTYEVTRVVGNVVQLRSLKQPLSLWVAKKELYNYFIGVPKR
jgi:hypothetical protein